ncbi:MAG: helix-hairpin-helix domain-containing protein [Chthoniobacterales bacterium]
MRQFVRLFALTLCFLASPLLAHGPWQVIPNCRLVPNESNDGDSFHVYAAGREYIFRLYFVDAPETDESFPDRVDEQAKYFALSHSQTVQLGNLAKQFMKEKLAPPFIVRTCMQDALGRSVLERFYAFVGTNDGDLGELLVANGLARLHGTQGQPVGLTSPRVEWQKLERLEREAKTQKIGGWGASVGRMTARLPKPLSVAGAGSFDAWFHPERLASKSEAITIAEPTPTPFGVQGSWAFDKPVATATPFPTAKPKPTAAATPGKLDPNTATVSELMAVPHIGEAIAHSIVEARPFKSADELRKVKGIGSGKRYEQVRPYFN